MTRNRKRKRKEFLEIENNNPNNAISSRDIISSIKYDSMPNKRQKVFEVQPLLLKERSTNTACSSSTAYTISQISKRREHKGFKVYK